MGAFKATTRRLTQDNSQHLERGASAPVSSTAQTKFTKSVGKIGRQSRSCHWREKRDSSDAEEYRLGLKFLAEVDSIDQEALRTERSWEKLTTSLDGPLSRGFRHCRSNRGWHLLEPLRQRCIAMGGCCGRECQCCEKRELSSESGSRIGHCTVECDCCSRTKGLDITPRRRECVYRDPILEGTYRDCNCGRMFTAYVWEYDTHKFDFVRNCVFGLIFGFACLVYLVLGIVVRVLC